MHQSLPRTREPFPLREESWLGVELVIRDAVEQIVLSGISNVILDWIVAVLVANDRWNIRRKIVFLLEKSVFESPSDTRMEISILSHFFPQNLQSLHQYLESCPGTCSQSPLLLKEQDSLSALVQKTLVGYHSDNALPLLGSETRFSQGEVLLYTRVLQIRLWTDASNSCSRMEMGNLGIICLLWVMEN